MHGLIWATRHKGQNNTGSGGLHHWDAKTWSMFQYIAVYPGNAHRLSAASRERSSI